MLKERFCDISDSCDDESKCPILETKIKTLEIKQQTLTRNFILIDILINILLSYLFWNDKADLEKSLRV